MIHDTQTWLLFSRFGVDLTRFSAGVGGVKAAKRSPATGLCQRFQGKHVDRLAKRIGFPSRINDEQLVQF